VRIGFDINVCCWEGHINENCESWVLSFDNAMKKIQ